MGPYVKKVFKIREFQDNEVGEDVATGVKRVSLHGSIGEYRQTVPGERGVSFTVLLSSVGRSAKRCEDTKSSFTSFYR